MYRDPDELAKRIATRTFKRRFKLTKMPVYRDSVLRGDGRQPRARCGHWISRRCCVSSSTGQQVEARRFVGSTPECANAVVDGIDSASSTFANVGHISDISLPLSPHGARWV